MPDFYMTFLYFILYVKCTLRIITDTDKQTKKKKQINTHIICLLEGQTHLPAIFMFLFNMILSNDIWEQRKENPFRKHLCMEIPFPDYVVRMSRKTSGILCFDPFVNSKFRIETFCL